MPIQHSIPAITGRLRKRLILDLSVALGGGTAAGYAYWYVQCAIFDLVCTDISSAQLPFSCFSGTLFTCQAFNDVSGRSQGNELEKIAEKMTFTVTGDAYYAKLQQEQNQ